MIAEGDAMTTPMNETHHRLTAQANEDFGESKESLMTYLNVRKPLMRGWWIATGKAHRLHLPDTYAKKVYYHSLCGVSCPALWWQLNGEKGTSHYSQPCKKCLVWERRYDQSH